MELLSGEVDFNIVNGFEGSVEAELTLVLVKAWGGGGAGALRGPTDSNRSFCSNVEFYNIFCNFATHTRLQI